MIEAIVKLALGSEVVQAAATSGSDLVIFWGGQAAQESTVRNVLRG
jgi:hypothetical protein